MKGPGGNPAGGDIELQFPRSHLNDTIEAATREPC